MKHGPPFPHTDPYPPETLRVATVPLPTSPAPSPSPRVSPDGGAAPRLVERHAPVHAPVVIAGSVTNSNSPEPSGPRPRFAKNCPRCRNPRAKNQAPRAVQVHALAHVDDPRLPLVHQNVILREVPCARRHAGTSCGRPGENRGTARGVWSRRRSRPSAGARRGRRTDEAMTRTCERRSAPRGPQPGLLSRIRLASLLRPAWTILRGFFRLQSLRHRQSPLTPSVLEHQDGRLVHLHQVFFFREDDFLGGSFPREEDSSRRGGGGGVGGTGGGGDPRRSVTPSVFPLPSENRPVGNALSRRRSRGGHRPASSRRGTRWPPCPCDAPENLREDAGGKIWKG